MARKLNGIELTRYDDLFKTDAEREADQQERVQIVPAEQVFPYARQPYSVDRPSADLVRLMDSIERTGIAEPLIVRPRSEGGYEIISGHRRDYCAKVVGLDTRPVIVRNYSDEDADILVVDYNINRENLLPSEKAKAYKLKLDAMKRRTTRKKCCPRWAEVSGALFGGDFGGASKREPYANSTLYPPDEPHPAAAGGGGHRETEIRSGSGLYLPPDRKRTDLPPVPHGAG